MRIRVIKIKDKMLKFKEIDTLKTSVDFGKKILFLPYSLEQAIKFTKDITK